MLEEIRIGSLGVIDSSTLELGPGLTVITGETGAGKTMIVTALGLLLGGRADSGAVRTGSRTARVEGVVSATDLAELRRRGRGGRGRGRGRPGRAGPQRLAPRAAPGRSSAAPRCPSSVLAEVAEPLVAVHGQSDQHRLLQARGPARGARPVRRRRGGRAAGRLHGAPRAPARHRAGARRGGGHRPRPGPRGRPAAVRARRGRGGRARAGRGHRAGGRGGPARASPTSCAPPPSRPARRSPASRTSPTRSARRRPPAAALDGVRDHDPEAAELADRLAEISYLLSDARGRRRVLRLPARDRPGPAGGRVGAAGGADRADPQVRRDHRRGAGLGRAVGGPTRSTSTTPTSGSRSCGPSATDLRERAAASPRRRCPRPAPRPPAGWPTRSPPSSPLLAMPDARIEVTVRQDEVADDADGSREPLVVDGRRLRFTATGVDDVELLLAANTGSEPRPLHKGASGGELSRVMLALEVSLAGTSPVPTFVFDEVDAGVGGARGGRDRPPAGPARAERPGAGGDPPAPGRGVRRPPRRRREVQRRLGHHAPG